MVCRKLKEDWGHHKGLVYCYGDATGGARGTAKVRGSDWELIKQELGPTFSGRLRFRVPDRNPPPRARLNAVNSRLESVAGVVRFLVDPIRAPHVVEDLEEVVLAEGSAGEVDKNTNKMLTHLSEAIGYYVAEKHPLRAGSEVVIRQYA
jgi:hypothetical protein